MSEKAMAREKYDSNEGWLEDVIMNAWLENDLKRKRELAHRGLAQEAAIAVAAALPQGRAREEIAREVIARKLAEWDTDFEAERCADAIVEALTEAAILSSPAVQGEGRVPESDQDHESKTPVVPPIGQEEIEARHYPRRDAQGGSTIEIVDRQFDFVRAILPYDYRYTCNAQQWHEAERICQALEGPMISGGVVAVNATGMMTAPTGDHTQISRDPLPAPPAPTPEGEWRPDVDEIARAICGHPRGCQLALGRCDQCKDDINVLGVLKAAARVAALPPPAPAPEGEWRCGNCDDKVEPEWKYCAWCGSTPDWNYLPAPPVAEPIVAEESQP